MLSGPGSTQTRASAICTIARATSQTSSDGDLGAAAFAASALSGGGAARPAPGLALIRAPSGEHGSHRLAEDVEIEPKRPVADVVAVVRFLRVHVRNAARDHLPHPGETGAHLSAQVE